jgi:hypothetical protein
MQLGAKQLLTQTAGASVPDRSSLSIAHYFALDHSSVSCRITSLRFCPLCRNHAYLMGHEAGICNGSRAFLAFFYQTAYVYVKKNFVRFGKFLP